MKWRDRITNEKVIKIFDIFDKSIFSAASISDGPGSKHML